MRFRIWGIQFTLLHSLPYLFAITKGFWVFNIPRLISITNMTTPEQALVLVFDKESNQFKLDLGWDRCEIVVRNRYVKFARSIQWVQAILGKIMSPALIDTRSIRIFPTKHGSLAIYLASGYSYYSRLPMFKFKPVSGYTYYVIHPDGTISDRREYVAITSRAKCPTMEDAVVLIVELLDLSATIGDDIREILAQSTELLAQTKVTINKLE